MILCSAGKGTMEEAECLSCALAGDNLCGFDYLLLKKLHEREERPNVHVTDLTGCLRRAFYSKKVGDPEILHDRMYLTLGLAVHDALEDGDENVECEVPLEVEGIKGRVDAIYADGTVVDFKTTRWLNTNRVPYGSHAKQLNIYGWMLRKLGREPKKLKVQYIDLSGPTKCRKHSATYQPIGGGEIACPVCGASRAGSHLGAVMVEVDMIPHEQIEREVLERRDALQHGLDTNEVPRAEPGFLCAYCPYVYMCPEGANR